MRQIWKNGEILPEERAVYSVYSEPLMFGTAIFEMMRTFNCKTFRLREHLDRLFNSMKMLSLEIPYSKEDIFHAHEELLNLHIVAYPEVEEWRTLINVDRGILPMYQPLLNDDGKPNIIITCFPLEYVLKGKSWIYTEGVHAIVPFQRAIPEYLLDPKIKSRSRQHYKVADLEVQRQDPKAWALLLDPNGFVAEGTGANFAIVKNNEVISPYPVNCLDGISMRFVNELATFETFNTLFLYEELTLYDVIAADEAFFTCTPFCIVPCTKVNGKLIGTGQVGEVTRELINKWIESVDCNFVTQAEKWDK